ncbi:MULTISPECIES: PP0621 family protein [Helicobacter]|uniref:PP0621 family protein n=1 Tax=Helicobacter ibis TaxID=2962633 RepID=A0ABT4VC03_9HELI|nr:MULTISPECIES: PP0621 family protein [Helicobacter]MDA3967008.1 PP0621 family protein [Helicobacter sp. WB40]MDA3968234.1 PP0621 family protein [Helicobacter ibis]
MQWLVVILLIVGVYYFFIRKSSTNKIFTKTKENKKNIEEMCFECKRCGTFVSSSESIIKDGEYYCSKECANLK